ncbi:MAG: hypothetical protein H7245_19050 [Candidatus Saccharibacteria bacterium]|nr:hypothetical protein [Pseudorhodobacter sp.]
MFAVPSSLDLAKGDASLTDAVRRSRKLLHRRALVAAAAGTVPIPGLDWAVDAALLSRLIPAINKEFGLAPEQIDRLEPRQREQVQKAVAMVGSALIGKFISRELIVRVARTIGVRMTAGQAAKFVPLAGQAISAVVGYTAIRYLGEEHLKDCVRVVLTAQLQLPAPRPVASSSRKP